MNKYWPKVFSIALTLALIVSFLPAQTARAAVSLSTTTATTENFDGIGTSATATLPTDWRVSKDATNVRTVGSFATATSATERQGGNNLSTTAGNGIYNYGAGDAATATDRAIGFLSSSSATKSGNLYAQFNNGTGDALSGITISYDVEKYRGGSNPAGFSVQLYYSFDGATWTSAGSSFLTSFSADASNSGYTSAPGTTVSVTNQPLNVNIPNGSDFYLAWNYSVTTGATTSNAQGLGIDNFSIIGTAAPIPTNPTGVGTATPSTLFAGDTALLTVAVTPGTNPTSTNLAVSCDLTGIGGSAQTFYDDGTNGDVTAGDNTFSYATAIAGGTTGGAKSLTCTIGDDQLRTGNTSIGLTVTAIVPIGTVNGPVLDTDDGTMHRSPYAPPSGNSAGSTIVTIQGVIYEKTLQAISNSTNTYKGFFIQNAAATADSNPNTSDGIFVYMGTYTSLIGGYVPVVGDEVVLSGKVTEYYNETELSSTSLVKLVRSGVDIDAEVSPVVANPPVSLTDANRYWERLQGMRVQVPMNSVVLGGRNVFSPADAEIWVANPDSTIAQRSNPYARKAFRDAHPLDDNYDLTNWDGNGYRILMGSLGIKATAGDAQALIDPVRSYSTVNNAPAGGINYTFSKYRIEISGQPTFNEGVDPAANNPPTVFDRSIHYTIADYNLENLYDYRNNPSSGCDFTSDTGCPKVAPFLAAVTPPYDYVPASDATYQARLTDIAHQIITDLHSPDILMVQEVENQDICIVTGGTFSCPVPYTDGADGKPDVLQELAVRIASLGGPAYDAAFDRDSSDLRGIAPAFLYRTDRVQLLPAAGDPVLGGTPVIDGYTSVPYDSDVSNPKTLNAIYSGAGACETSWVFPRAPDIGLFRIYSTGIGVGSYRDIYVIDNHFKSGPDTCVAHRTEQAKYNAALVAFIQAANPNARIVVGGDLNVYPRPDDIAYGASDQLGSLYDPSLGLKNLWEVLLGQTPESAYSYVYLGMAQTLDQMFVNQSMLADLKQFRIAHINSDFPADYPGDVARGTSDHDPNVATFLINEPPTVDAGGPYTVDEGSSITLAATGTDPEGQPLTYAWDLDNNGSFETPGQSVSFTSVDGPATLAVKAQVTDNGGLTAVASATVTVNNVAPTATLGNNGPVNENSPVTISFSGQTDPSAADTSAGFHYTYACDGSSLAGATYAGSGTNASTTCTFVDGPSSNTVRALIIDKDGGYTEYTTVVMVDNVAPTVDISQTAVTNLGILSGNGSFVDAGADTWTATVNYGDNSGVQNLTLNPDKTFALSHTYSSSGTYTLEVCVSDDDGGSGCDQAQVAVLINRPPVANAGGPYTTTEGKSITLNASMSTDPDNNIVLYEWDLDNDGQFDDATGVKPKFSALDNGVFTVSVRVTDAGGLSSVGTTTVTVRNLPPVITSFTITNLVRVGANVNARVVFRDAGVNDTFTAVWNWGDGSTSNGSISNYTVSGSHAYAKQGIYLVTITITDKDGGVARAYNFVIVSRR